MNINRFQIQFACGDNFYRRGKKYFDSGKVLSFNVHGSANDDVNTLHSIVKGSGNHTYQQVIELTPYGDEVDIQGDCSCPVGYNCKHVAAVCLAYLDNPDMSGNHASHKLQHMLSNWLNTLAREDRATQAIGNADYPVYIINEEAFYYSDKKADCRVNIRVTRQRKNGKGLAKGRSIGIDHLIPPFWNNSTHIEPVDTDIGKLLTASESSRFTSEPHILEGISGGMALSLMVDTGRCYWGNIEGLVLTKGEPRSIECQWEKNKQGDFSLHSSLAEDMLLIASEPAMYIDTTIGEVGTLDGGGWSGAQLKSLLSAPTIPAAQAKLFSTTLFDEFPQLPMATPIKIEVEDNHGPMQPWLTLSARMINGQQQHCVLLDFAYQADRLQPLPIEQKTMITRGDKRINIYRDGEAESRASLRLNELGFKGLLTEENSTRASMVFIPGNDESGVIDTPSFWANFIEQTFATLEGEGWKVSRDEYFQLQFNHADWNAELIREDSDNDWFSLRFDLKIGQQTVPLVPLLIPLLDTDFEELPDMLTLEIESDHYVRLPVARIKPFLETLKELFNRSSTDKEGILKVSRFDAVAIDQLGDHIKGARKLRQLAKKLNDFSGIKSIPAPKGLQAELRPYQQTGLDWLQFLRQYKFNGILADDMGLGKTIQTLAHVLVEKKKRRLKSPVLIIAPTSLMGNWRREAEKFTPALRVVVLHGSDRHKKYESLSDGVDIILTTYPLIVRDKEKLSQHHYHSLILDEAQAIKNPNTKLARCVRALQADHRLCLSGTPLENHVGELWSLFDFLMPGFLGSKQQFNKFYRNPIEKSGDLARNQHLATRVQPFMLRRTKSEVADDLPPKTEIKLRVTFDKDQAVLYESIRVSVDKKVQQVIAKQGLARSHITILDALLKLRQVCCDPTLLKIKKKASSAKMKLLMQLLPEQLEEGRRILVFSQFTSMLSLIEDELKKQNILYSKLTGQTRKRDEAINRFRSGDVNVFLISLKAGGVGLNLVEADTVIIYDPWWNPAVENQAIDRAHRIGQDKPVFIYKLIAENSVEEKMLTMQKNKLALAEGIYRKEEKSSSQIFNADTLKELFAPLRKI